MKKYHIFSIFSCFGLFRQVFGQVNLQPILERHKMIRVLHVCACPIVLILFYDLDWHGVFKVMKKDHFQNIFNSFGLFPGVFRQLKECLTLQLHEMIRVLHEVACPIVCVLCCDRYWQIGVLKLMKNYHLFIFSRFCPFP